PDINFITCYWHIFYLKWRGSWDPDYIAAIAADEDYITLWGSITVDTALINHPTLGYLLNHNAILTLANIATNPILTNQTCPWLATVCNLFPRLHIDWLLSIIAINDAGVCVQYNLCEDLLLLMQEVKQMLFPYTYRY
ncbi:MAG: hypothetical protein WC341_10685, partial [Bacteroidales bacterium]